MNRPNTTPAWPWVVFGLVLVGLAAVDSLTAWQYARHFTYVYNYWIETTVGTLSLATVGAVICTRVPGNRVGPIMLGLACLSVVQDTAGALSLTGVHEGWSNPFVGTTGGIFAAAQLSAVAGAALLLFLAPTGQPLTHRWRRIVQAFVVLVGIGVVASIFDGPNDDALIGYPCSPPAPAGATCHSSGAGAFLPHPSAPAHSLTQAGGPVLVVGLFLGCVCLALRWLRARGTQRQQVTWVVIGGLAGPAIILGDMFISILLFGRGYQPSNLHGSLVWAAAGAALPLGIAIAVLRHGLYDLDRVVSRTVSYAIVTGGLVLVYAVTVTLASKLLGAKSSLAVAAATLAAAAAFQPLLRRVRGVVDRRFDRARYDTAATVARFSRALDRQVELRTIESSLALAVHDTVSPTSVSLWLRSRQ